MTRRRGIFLTALIFGCVALFLAVDAQAQPIEDREPLRLKSTVRTTGTKRTRRPPPKKRTSDSSLLVRRARKTPRVVTDKTSDLTIETTEGATVVMALQRGRLKPLEIKRTAVNGKAVFENLNPGKYVLTAERENYVEQETELTVNPQETATLNFPLEPIRYQLNIETNIPDGEVRYAPAERIGVNPDGSVKLQPSGDYCIVQIKNKQAKITGLSKDYYTIDVNPSQSALEYEPLKATITPDLIVDEEDETEGIQYIDIDLEIKVSNQTFTTAWSGRDWEMPPGWRLEDKMVTAGINGVALPNDPYRHYTNFEMRSTVRSLDGKTVGFAVRALNKNNYYLIQVGGNRAVNRYMLTAFTVKNGVPTQLRSIDISAFDSVIDDRKWFTVIIRGEGNTFRIFIENRRGERQPVGDVTDPYENYKKGAVGVAEINNSNFEVGAFTVCPNSCGQ